MNVTHTITVLELVWTLVAFIGLLFTTRLLWKSYQDMEWLQTYNVNGDHHIRKYVAFTSILIFLGGTITQLSYTLVGIVAMTQRNHNGGENPHVASILIAGIFITASFTGTVFAAIIYSRRTKVIREVAEKLVHSVPMPEPEPEEA